MYIQDADGNRFLGSLDQLGGQSVTDARSQASTLGSLNAEIAMDLNGKAVATFDVRATAGALTVIFEGTEDGTNYFQLPALAVVDSTGALTVRAEQFVMAIVIATTHACIYQVGVSGLKRIRAKVSAYTSGSVVVSCRASAADYLIYARPIPAMLSVPLAPAVNTGGTITLPAAGAGLFHYVTNFQASLAMNPATAQTGGAALFLTTTNLPGTPAWPVPIIGNTAISTGGSNAFIEIANVSWANPLKSSVANTATTFVLPAPGAAMVWRANVQYFVGA